MQNVKQENVYRRSDTVGVNEALDIVKPEINWEREREKGKDKQKIQNFDETTSIILTAVAVYNISVFFTKYDMKPIVEWKKTEVKPRGKPWPWQRVGVT